MDTALVVNIGLLAWVGASVIVAAAYSALATYFKQKGRR